MSENLDNSGLDREPNEDENARQSLPEQTCPDAVGEKSEVKRKKGISLTAFILSTVSLILVAVMVTYVCLADYYKGKLAEIQLGSSQNSSYNEKYYPFDLFGVFLDKYSFEEYDEDEMIAAALKAYVASTGDKYAYYYTAEEYDELNKASAGSSEGIGINIIYTEATVNGYAVKVIKVINVSQGSPADEFGLKVGDLIYSVYDGETYRTVDSLGYDVAMTYLKGASGTEAVFTVLRPAGEKYHPIECRIVREGITVDSVYYKKHSLDASVGVIKILNFDKTTPSQFTNAVDTLRSQGCTKFVFDVRHNPGGELISIETVLSYFLDEGDVIIRTLYKDGNEEFGKVGVTDYTGAYFHCNVRKEDIGKYKDLDAVVLCNGSTASAAELFVATFKDYGIATVVGEKTFGKGSMQSIIPLSYYGYEGALKLTVAKYFSGANGGYNDGYDGVGIEPDVPVKQSEELSSKNIYEITDAEDDQLRRALECFRQ